MNIHSARSAPPVVAPKRRPFDGPRQNLPDPPVYNSKPEDRWLARPKQALIGAALGAGGLGLALSAAGGGAWGVVGLALGAAGGAYIGDNLPQLSYDAKAFHHYRTNKHTARALEKSYNERQNALVPLTEEHRIAFDPSGDVKRKFDGYDSSRNITGLFAQEGETDKPYRFAVELANLRPNAQKKSLHTKLDLGSVSLDISDDNDVTKGAGQEPRVKSKYSVRYNQLILEVDKAVLRESGWSDGEPLKVKVSTHSEQGAEPFDTLVASTDDKNPEKFFRWEGKSIYQVVTDRFHNGDKTNDFNVDPSHHERFHGGDWQGVIDKLDYLDDLGVDCVWISCPYENDRDFFGNDGYHGYWPHNFREAEKSFGDKKKLKELVDQAHKRGMKVIMDVVVNHTGYNHPGNQDPAFREWFHRDGGRNPISQYGLENGSLAGLPDLAQENPEVSHYLIDVHKMWAEESGVDGFRVDAIRHVPSGFLRDFDRSLKEGKDQFITIGEVFWNDENYLAGYQNETQDSLFDFPLMQSILDVFGGNPEQTLMERWEQFQEVKKHNFGQALMDVTNSGGSSFKKISEVLARDHVYDNPRLLSPILDNHDTNRFLTHAGGNRDKLKVAAAFLYGVRGTPSLYYGTEAGLKGELGSNRQDMEFGADPEMHDHFQKLIKMRRSSQALQLGTQNELAVTDNTYAFSRALPGQEVVCCYSNSTEPTTVTVPLTETQMKDGAVLKSLMDDRRYTVKDGKVEVQLEPMGFAFLDWSSQ